MRLSTGRWIGLLALVLVVAAASAKADPIYGTDASGEMVGSRMEGAGITTGGNYASDGDAFIVSWNIADLGGGMYSYEYTFSGYSRPDISHFTLDLTDDCVGPPVLGGCVSDHQPEEADLEFGEFGPHPSNPGFPALASLVGVKFDNLPEGTFNVSFTSDRAPVYGDFYLKGGNDSFAFNNGLANHASANVADFIPRPNGAVTTPEPGLLLLVGGGLLGLALRRRRLR